MPRRRTKRRSRRFMVNRGPRVYRSEWPSYPRVPPPKAVVSAPNPIVSAGPVMPPQPDPKPKDAQLKAVTIAPADDCFKFIRKLREDNENIRRLVSELSKSVEDCHENKKRHTGSLPNRAGEAPEVLDTPEEIRPFYEEIVLPVLPEQLENPEQPEQPEQPDEERPIDFVIEYFPEEDLNEDSDQLCPPCGSNKVEPRWKVESLDQNGKPTQNLGLYNDRVLAESAITHIMAAPGPKPTTDQARFRGSVMPRIANPANDYPSKVKPLRVRISLLCPCDEDPNQPEPKKLDPPKSSMTTPND